MNWWYWAIGGGGALVILGVVGAFAMGVFPTSDPRTENEVARQTPAVSATAGASESQLDDGGSQSEQLAASASSDSQTDGKPADYQKVYQAAYDEAYSQRYSEEYEEGVAHLLDRLGYSPTDKQRRTIDKNAKRIAERYASEWATIYTEVYVATGSDSDAYIFANRIENGELKDYAIQLDSGKSHKYALAYALQIENGNSSEYAAAYAQQIEDGNSEQDADAYARQIEDGDSEEYADSHEFKLEWQTSATDIEAGESFTLNVRMYDVQDAGDHGGITVSFPSLTQAGGSKERHSSSVADVEAVDYTSGLSKVTFHQPGATIYHRENDRQFPSEYLLVESDDASWSSSDDRTLRLRITPKRGEEFPIQIRGWLCADEYTDCSRNPAEGAETDQQGWVVEVVKVSVEGSSAAAQAPSSQPSAPTPEEERIAFQSDREGNWEIYVMNADGSDVTRLTDNLADDFFPSWSPDGQRIAFMSRREDNWEIYVVNADGSGLTRLTDNSVDDAAPSWSPDGRYIAFASRRDGTEEIYAMNVDGSGVIRLTDNESLDVGPSWSPDGRRIAFYSTRDGDFEIYIMNANGSRVTRLTDNESQDVGPSWSPDGRYIAFHSDRDGDFEIYIMNADGSGVSRLTDNSANDEHPDWSPDGRRIAFISDRDGDYEIYVMNADGSDVIQLTDNSTDDVLPSWSPSHGEESEAVVSETPSVDEISYAFQHFHVIWSPLDEYGDHDAECKSRLGNQYRLADWNDLTSWVSGGGSIPELIAGLRLKKEGDSSSIYPHDGAEIDGRHPRVSFNGKERLNGGRRHFFISRHDHILPSYFAAHDHIDNYHISLGSWYGEGATVLCYNSSPTATPTTAPVPAPATTPGQPPFKLEVEARRIYVEDFDRTLDTDRWLLSGSAEHLRSDGIIQLTAARENKLGILLHQQPINSEGFSIEFSFVIGGGSGADGLGFALLRSIPDFGLINPLYDAGGVWGSRYLDGFIVAFDTHRNESGYWRAGGRELYYPVDDPSSNFVALAELGAGDGEMDITHLATENLSLNLRNSGIFDVAVVFGGDGHVKVYLSNADSGMDRTMVLGHAIENYTPFDAYFAFIAATGGLTDRHVL